MLNDNENYLKCVGCQSDRDRHYPWKAAGGYLECWLGVDRQTWRPEQEPLEASDLTRFIVHLDDGQEIRGNHEAALMA